MWLTVVWPSCWTAIACHALIVNRAKSSARARKYRSLSGGAASHNTANALAAAALTHCLGIPVADIREGLTSMSQDANPGRSNVYSISKFQVLVDFAHNLGRDAGAVQHGARTARQSADCLLSLRRGDRTDASIRELAQSAWSIGASMK